MRGSASSYRLTSPLRKNRKWRQNDREDGDRSLDLIQGDSDRGDIPESDTQPGRRRGAVCRASADHPTANGYHGGFLGSCQAVEGKKGLEKKAARNDE